MSVALITGTSSGIGQATALHLARQGYRVFATMRNAATGGEPLRSAAAAEKLALEILPLDVTDAGSVTGAVAEAESRAGRLDVLVNNAGIGTLATVEEVTDAQARELFETNFFGPLRMMRAVLPGMRRRGGGTIVNVSSVAAHITGPLNGLYSASKRALEGLSEAVAIEARRFGVRVVIIEPGFFRTEIVARAAAEAAARDGSPYAELRRRMAMIYGHAAQNGGDPADVARAIGEAIAAPAPRLRHLVGDDAQAWVSGRRRLSDEAWIDSGRAMTDEEWLGWLADNFPR